MAHLWNYRKLQTRTTSLVSHISGAYEWLCMGVRRITDVITAKVHFLVTLLSCKNYKRKLQLPKDGWFIITSLYKCTFGAISIWAPSSEFVSSSIPSWQILTAHVQPFRGARDLAFCLKVPLDSLLVWASSEGSGETARMRRLAWTFAARIGGKYQIRLTQPI